MENKKIYLNEATFNLIRSPAKPDESIVITHLRKQYNERGFINGFLPKVIYEKEYKEIFIHPEEK